MRATISAAFRTAAEAQETSEVFLVFATITHPSLSAPVCVVNDVVDFVYNGNTYKGCPFEISLVSDSESRPQAQIAVQNVDRVIGEVVLGLSDSPRLKLEVICLSQFNDGVDPRVEIAPGSTVVDYTADHLRLAKVSIDAMRVTGDIISWDYAQEPWPVLRATKNRLPGLYR